MYVPAVVFVILFEVKRVVWSDSYQIKVLEPVFSAVNVISSFTQPEIGVAVGGSGH